MFQPTPESALRLGQLRTEQWVREAEAERLSREARGGTPHPAERLIAPARAALAAIVRLGQQRTPSPVNPVEPAQTTGNGVGLAAAKPAAS